ncbi:MAG: hypothetical protein WKF75_09240 [Singulisphaera sp.]
MSASLAVGEYRHPEGVRLLRGDRRADGQLQGLADRPGRLPSGQTVRSSTAP